jgi:tRNA A37 threonylcarbamoyladenosine synthetase subunit TsaC/SUA5/YrdC
MPFPKRSSYKSLSQNNIYFLNHKKHMNTKFKRHQKVKLLRAPLIEDIEPYADNPEETKSVEIKAGMPGKINLILPNGQYHVEILDNKGDTIAYVAMDEEGLDAD